MPNIPGFGSFSGGGQAGELFVRFTGNNTDLLKKSAESEAAVSKTAASAEKNTAGAAAGMSASWALAGAAIGGFVALGARHLIDLQKAEVQTNAVLKSTGNAANQTADQIRARANALEQMSSVDDVAIQREQNLLLTFTQVRDEAGRGNDIFSQATQVILDMSVALGEDLQSATIQVGKALNDPIKGITALRRVGVSFTAEQQQQIKTMVESGHTMEAQKAILAELTKEFGGSAEALGGTVAGKWRLFVDSIEDLSSAFLEGLIPALEPALKLITDLIRPIGQVVAFLGKLNPLLPLVAAGLIFLNRSTIAAAASQLLLGIRTAATAGTTIALGTAAKGAAVSVEAEGVASVAAAEQLTLFTAAEGAAATGASALYTRLLPLLAAIPLVTFNLQEAGTKGGESAKFFDGWVKSVRDGSLSLAQLHADLLKEAGSEQAYFKQTGESIDDTVRRVGKAAGVVQETTTQTANAYEHGIEVANRYADAVGNVADVATEGARDQDRATESIKRFNDLLGTGKGLQTFQGLLQLTGQSADQFREDLHTAYLGGAQDLADFVADQKAKLREWQQATAERFGNVEGLFGDLAQTSHLTAQKIIKQFEDQIRSQENWQTNFDTVADRLKGKHQDLLNSLQAMGLDSAGILRVLANASKQQFDRIVGDFERTKTKGKEIAGEIRGDMVPAFSGMSRTISNIPAWVMSVLTGKAQDSIDAVVRKAQSGGLVFVRHSGGMVGEGPMQPNRPLGPGEVPVIAKQGEFVVRDDKVQKNRAILEAINDGSWPPWPAFHDGGMVGFGDAIYNLRRGSDSIRHLAAAFAATGRTLEGSLDLAPGWKADPHHWQPGGGPIVAAAKAELGKPYVFGASGPNAFDCSGLVYWVLNHAGYHVPRLTAAGYQGYFRSHPSRAQVTAGDLPLFWFPNDRGLGRGTASHIGIAVNNGQMINALHSGAPVKYDPIFASAYIGARRVAGAGGGPQKLGAGGWGVFDRPTFLPMVVGDRGEREHVSVLPESRLRGLGGPVAGAGGTDGQEAVKELRRLNEAVRALQLEVTVLTQYDSRTVEAQRYRRQLLKSR